LTDHFNTSKPISLILTDYKEPARTTTIEPNSENYKNFITWTEDNQADWESTLASYLNPISITQDNFSLFYFKEGYVVVNFIDNKGEGNQYKRKIRPGELDFILNKFKTN
jgi:hypothetical protein